MNKTLTTALLFVATHIYGDAGNNCCCPDTLIYLSHPDYVFEVQGSALLLQPTGSDLHYAAQATPLPVQSPDWRIHDINTHYHWGFDIGLRGIFHHTHTNLSANWEHFHSTDSASKNVNPEDMIGPFFEIGPDASPYKRASGRVTFHFDEVNLDYGITVTLGDRLETNLFGGVSIANIKQKIFSRFSNLDNTVVRTITVPSTYTGAGPQLGLDFNYRIAKGFHFTGDAAAALLVGTQKNHTSFTAVSPALVPFMVQPNRQKTHTHEKTQVVPAFEGKLGLSYVYTFCNDTMLGVEAGYQAQVYLNALRSVDIGSEVVTPPVTPDTIGVFARTFESHQNNFALAGFYITIAVGF